MSRPTTGGALAHLGLRTKRSSCVRKRAWLVGTGSRCLRLERPWGPKDPESWRAARTASFLTISESPEYDWADDSAGVLGWVWFGGVIFRFVRDGSGSGLYVHLGCMSGRPFRDASGRSA